MFPIPTVADKAVVSAWEVRDVARIFRIVVSARRYGHAMAEPAQLDEAEAEGQEPADPDEKDDHAGDVAVPGRDAPLPHEGPHGADETLEAFHLHSLLPSVEARKIVGGLAEGKPRGSHSGSISPRGRPPRRCTCTWYTSWPPCSLQFRMSR